MRPATSPSTLRSASVERAIERLRDTVRAAGLKNSAVRESIARVALNKPGHYSADELASDIRQVHERVHPATVYRVLPLLVDAGLLQVSLVSHGDAVLYERAFERDHHDHLICTKCGEIVEFEFEAFELLQRDIADRFGYELTGHVHELLGICARCRSVQSSRMPS